MRIIVLIALSCFCGDFAVAASLHVPRQHASIQPALDAAVPGDTVLVSPGIYFGPGNRNLDFSGKAISLISSAGASATLLDCEGKGRGFRFIWGEDTDCLVQGFTIWRGAALGAGADGKGAGFYCRGASPRIEACVFAQGEAIYGGGMGAEWNSHPILRGCLFLDNKAQLDGGALYLYGGGGELSNCNLLGNQAGGRGADAFLLDTAPEIDGCRYQEFQRIEDTRIP